MRKRIIVVCLLVFAFIFGSANLAVSALVEKHLMGLYSPTVNCNEPANITLFYAGSQVMNWASISGLNDGDIVQWDWFGPGGFHSVSKGTAVSGDACWWSWIFENVAVAPGLWSVQFSLNGNFLYQDDFTIVPLPSYHDLSISTIPLFGAGKITVDGEDCIGGSCQYSYVHGRTVTISVTPNAGWKVNYIKVGDQSYTSDSVQVTMDKDQAVLVSFWPASEKYSFRAVSTVPLGTKQPLVFIHGNHGEDNPSPYGWEKYIQAINRDRILSQKFKIYIASWNSNDNDFLVGRKLGAILDSYPELNGKEIIFVAHSRGGLVARYYMNYYVIAEKTYLGQKGGERTKSLFTLATPHHGSPAADPLWIDFSFNYNYKPALALALSYYYFDHLWDSTNVGLQWDILDCAPTTDFICWNSALNGDGFCSALAYGGNGLTILNRDEKYADKMVPFGGNKFSPKMDVQTALNNVNILNVHSQLYLSSGLLAGVPVPPDGYPDTPVDNTFRPFRANDGLVPLISALFLQPGSGQIFSFNKQGNLTYDINSLSAKLTTKKVYIASGLVDHADFLTNSMIIKTVMKELGAI